MVYRFPAATLTEGRPYRIVGVIGRCYRFLQYRYNPARGAKVS